MAVDKSVSAVDAAKVPFFRHAMETYPHTLLQASEEAVGLPAGQMGNSEVGHMNLGAGRVVYQELVRISKALDEGTFAEVEEWKNLLKYCKTNQKPLHLLGLLSDGGVHSHIKHLKGILTLLSGEADFPPVYIHCFMDGRDTDPHGGKDYIKDLEAHIQATGTGKIASIIGRYYAMDRNQKWGRIRKAYDLLTEGIGSAYPDALSAVMDSYAKDVTDEFILPAVMTENGKPVGTVQDGDAVFFFNFRTDRGRQLTRALTQEDMREFNMHVRPLYYATMTRYDDSFQGVKVLFDKEDIGEGLGEILAREGRKQIRIAETEKYPHVTFFFNGGREEPFEGEQRFLIPSPKVATYDLQPEMSALEIRDTIIREMEKEEVDFICLNFANPDMVGHTGVFDAAVKACETVDACTQAVVETALAHGYACLVTADHGNADKMINPDGTPNTAHTTALVPLYLADPYNRGFSLRAGGKLGDLAPTILQLMELPQPEAMTGNSLLTHV